MLESCGNLKSLFQWNTTENNYQRNKLLWDDQRLPHGVTRVSQLLVKCPQNSEGKSSERLNTSYEMTDLVYFLYHDLSSLPGLPPV